MKTTIDLNDDLARRAKRLAERDGTTLRAVIEHGIRLAIEEHRTRASPAPLRDARVGGRGLTREFARANWSELRDAAYNDTGQ